jgi:hypothetical protein
MRPALMAVLFSSCIAAATPALSADPILTLRVWPTMAREPASLKIVAIVPADDRNRGLEIIADSSEGYLRSSHIQLDGRDAQHVWDVEFRDVPRGRYEVIGVLTGTDGRRATVMRVVVVMPQH